MQLNYVLDWVLLLMFNGHRLILLSQKFNGILTLGFYKDLKAKFWSYCSYSLELWLVADKSLTRLSLHATQPDLSN